MAVRKFKTRCWAAAVLASAALVGITLAQMALAGGLLHRKPAPDATNADAPPAAAADQSPAAGQPAQRPAYQVADRSEAAAAASAAPALGPGRPASTR